jgi:hypothetical protein
MILEECVFDIICSVVGEEEEKKKSARAGSPKIDGSLRGRAKTRREYIEATSFCLIIKFEYLFLEYLDQHAKLYRWKHLKI